MTKIEELEQRLEVMEQVTKAYGIFKEEVEQLQKELAELKEGKKGKGKWKPEEGDEIWFRNMTGKASYLYYREGIDIKSNLVFKTKEACERYWHFMDTVKEKSYEFSKEEWEDTNIHKFHIQYDAKDKEFEVDDYTYLKFVGMIYFKDKESAQNIIDNFKDELMEYFV